MLLDLLKNTTNPDVRCNAIQSLGFLKDTRVVPELFNYLHDPDPDIRMQTVHTLGDLQDKRAIKPLVEILKNDKDDLVRSYAAGFLSKFQGQPDVIEPLIAALTDKDEYVRMNAVMSLTELRAYRALEEIMQSLKDEAVSVRWWACQYLENFGDKQALPALEVLEKTSIDDRIFRKKSTLKEAAHSTIEAIRQRAE